ncbi:hypothetical protein JMA_22100 [Jeotgalibacillus malaysiensis]|uniref:Lipoxygenase domain-containing protein n=1 Tax=Jeotgalibacillus malaysiensis TaxID=1508404 RepID=A0A0B5AS56_9BACL|nr:hypothetical protein [Jeotgalibacillus malaysiensis]AJD91527.1 hypothetical protein JMA_22100 [Jeotgalibacillus malaysiensis]
MSETRDEIMLLTGVMRIKQKAFNRAVLDILIENGLVKNEEQFDERADEIFHENFEKDLKELEELIALRNND